ncbi:MAG: TonB family protein [Pseudomonadota bacterium]
MVSRYYPDQAQRQQLEGRASVACKVDVEGRLSGCVVTEEIPKGVGFGEATILLAENEFRMHPKLERGIPVEGTVLIPLVFKLPKTSAAERAAIAAETAADEAAARDAKAFAGVIAAHRTALSVFSWLSLLLPLAPLVLLAFGSRRRPGDA